MLCPKTLSKRNESLVENKYEDPDRFMMPVATSEKTKQLEIHQIEPSWPRKIILGSKEPLIPEGWGKPHSMG